MRTKPGVSRVVVEAPSTPDGRAACRDAAEVLARGDVVVLNLRTAPKDATDAIEQLIPILDRIVEDMVADHQLPSACYVEVDEESYGTPVAPFMGGRFLLPHQDGGHSSFLTPSRLDVPELDPAERVFSETVYWKRPSHKMFQGFLITETGEPPGETYYYDTLALLRDAYLRRVGSPGSTESVTVADIAQFLTENLRASRRLQTLHRSRYLTLGGMLGATDPALHVMPSGPRAESELWPEQYARLPQICSLVDACPCGDCTGPGRRLFCHSTTDLLGLSWPEFRRHYETSTVGERYDLLLANNLTQLHAADSAAERTIRPVCVVLDDPNTPEYEEWLSHQWHQWCRAGAETPAGVA